jgi:ABC-2 type transport system ATP-binding protein
MLFTMKQPAMPRSFAVKPGKPIITVKNLKATYGRPGPNQVQALKGISLEVQAGEIFGLLGPNGAGKTTLLSTLEGLHPPAEGEMKVAGLDVSRQARLVKRLLGIQLQHTAVLDDLKVYELVELYAALYDVFLSRSAIDDLLARFDLSDKANAYPRQLSGGQRQRLALAVAVANDPQVVLLDEPTGALDPQARRAMWGLIRRLHEEGRTVLLTTHSMEEAEALCRRVAIIDKGRLIALDTPASLVGSIQAGSMLKTDLDLPLETVRPLPGVLQARYTGQHLEVETHAPNETLAALSNLAASLGMRLGEVTMRQPNLEDVFLRLTGRPFEA